MTCQKCFNPMPEPNDRFNFCPYCGQPLRAMASLFPLQPVTIPYPVPYNPCPPYYVGDPIPPYTITWGSGGTGTVNTGDSVSFGTE